MRPGAARAILRAVESHGWGPLLFGIAVLLVAAKIGGVVAERWGQPPVLGELLVGIVLGNALGVTIGLGRYLSGPIVRLAARPGRPESMLVFGLAVCFAPRLRGRADGPGRHHRRLRRRRDISTRRPPARAAVSLAAAPNRANLRAPPCPRPWHPPCIFHPA